MAEIMFFMSHRARQQSKQLEAMAESRNMRERLGVAARMKRNIKYTVAMRQRMRASASS